MNNANNVQGVRVDCIEKFNQLLTPIVDRLGYLENDVVREGDQDWSTNTISIRLAADGTNIGRNVKLLNHTFTVINDTSFCKSACGNYSLGLYDIEKESYLETNACLKIALEKIESVKSISLKGVNFNIKFTNGGDMKYLLNLYGINPSTSKFPCLWCTTENINFHDFRRTHIKRTLKDALKLHLAKKFGYVNKPITSIPFDHCVIDLLHMMLRITDQLFDQLFHKIQLLDSSKDDLDLSTKPNLRNYSQFLEYGLKIKHPIQKTKENKLRLRSLNGLERLKILESIDIVELFPDWPLAEKEKYQKLWRDFYNIYVSLKNPNGFPREQMANTVKDSTLAWGELYKSLKWQGYVTPYIHAFVDHLYEMIIEHGDLSLWTMQGLEKLNDILSKEYFMCTNKHDDFLTQMINRRNRMELMMLFANDPEALFNIIHAMPADAWDSL